MPAFARPLSIHMLLIRSFLRLIDAFRAFNQGDAEWERMERELQLALTSHDEGDDERGLTYPIAVAN